MNVRCVHVVLSRTSLIREAINVEESLEDGDIVSLPGVSR